MMPPEETPTSVSEPPGPAIRDEIPFEIPSEGHAAPWKAAVIVGIVVLATLGYGWGAGWFAKPTTISYACTGELNLTGAGSTLPASLLSAWSAGFHHYSGCFDVSYVTAGDSEAASQLSSRTVYFAVTDAPLNASASQGLPDPVVTLPVALSAVAIIYNIPGVPTGLNLSGGVLASIYQGSITNWNSSALQALNPGVNLPNLTIVPVHESDSSGATLATTTYFAAASSSWRTEVGDGATVTWPVGLAANSSDAVASDVAGQSGAVGYLSLPQVSLMKIAYARLSNPAGAFLLPQSSSVAAAAQSLAGGMPLGNASWSGFTLVDAPGPTSYPIATFSYALVYEDMGITFGSQLSKNSAGWLATYFYWDVYFAQNYSATFSFVPLPTSVVSADVQILELLKYQGAPLIGDPDQDHD